MSPADVLCMGAAGGNALFRSTVRVLGRISDERLQFSASGDAFLLNGMRFASHFCTTVYTLGLLRSFEGRCPCSRKHGRGDVRAQGACA